MTVGADRVGYKYNAFGQPVIRTRNGTTERYFLWDGDDLLAELDASFNRVGEFEHLGTDEPFAVITGSTSATTLYYHLRDELGNVTGFRGNPWPEQSVTYDTWGHPTVSYQQAANRLFWKGLRWEGSGVDLYYMRARWYDPELGRFITEDPIGIDGGLNLYAFAGNDPINGLDPSGLGYRCIFVKGQQISSSGWVVIATPDTWVCWNTGSTSAGYPPQWDAPTGDRGRGLDRSMRKGRGGPGAPRRSGEASTPGTRRTPSQCFAENTAWLRSVEARATAVVAASTAVALSIAGKAAVAAGRAEVLKAAVDFDIFFSVPNASASLVEGAIARNTAGAALMRRGATVARYGVRGGLAGAVGAGAYFGTSYLLCRLNPNY